MSILKLCTFDKTINIMFPGRASFCTVRVVLADENDNAPRFRAVEYRMSIKANVAKGSLVTQIQATDPDAGSNGRITYSLYSEARLSLVDVLEVSMFCSLTLYFIVLYFTQTYLHYTVCLVLIELRTSSQFTSGKRCKSLTRSKPKQIYLMRVNQIKTHNLCYNPDFQLRDVLS